VEERSARFETVFGLSAGGRKLLFKGSCSGTISQEPRGDAGFGYDPIFVPLDGDGRTFAEMSLKEKNALSHRGMAVRNMLDSADEIAALLRQL
jgi:XTP/dITP diphosphohydrolase